MIAGGQALQAAGEKGHLQAAGQSLLALVEEKPKVKLCKLLAKEEPSLRGSANKAQPWQGAGGMKTLDDLNQMA